MSTNKIDINFRVDENFRSPEKEDYTQIGLVQRLQNEENKGVLYWNVLYLSHSETDNSSVSETDEVTFLRLVCRGDPPHKVQVQIKSNRDENTLAWCDYLRTNAIWLAVIPEVKPTNPPWNVYGVPIEMGSYIFGEQIKPKNDAGQALDYLFSASGGQIPKSGLRSIFSFFSSKP